ncbi:copper chaperone PCu(A)C [Marinimicrobium sp. ABcell2]|uniref:copper chaperone PCu(A)C n=1 Tax=Marinimicrobium sp. ABcell2 TaxID=3069751 RepID=UPI0027B3E589|nr:copper chaperone PCu(A)C [Marinimicrobium sp. ABcell2]MDQ2078229.1 copper chaperone PCu(A)C [Marinimicrobium sp. ABcell2]
MKYFVCVMMVVMASVVQAGEAPKVTQGVAISEAKVRVPMPGRDLTAAYFHVHNQRDQERFLVSVSSPIAERAELHSHSEVDGMMRMRREDKVQIPAQGHQHFQPGGYHVMLLDLRRRPQTGESVELVLTFDDGSQLSVDAVAESVFDRRHDNHHNHH